MAVLLNIPKETEEALRHEWGDLEGAARESLLIASYRAGKLSLGLLAQTLGMGVLEADSWLAQRHVSLNYTLDDLEADRQTLSGLARPPSA